MKPCLREPRLDSRGDDADCHYDGALAAENRHAPTSDKIRVELVSSPFRAPPR